MAPEIPGNEDKWDFEGLVTVEEVERTGVRGKLRVVQHACRAEVCKVPSSVIEVLEIATSVGVARKEEAALERSNAQNIGDLGKMRTK